MKCNANIKIVGEKVILIPYEAKHVSKYHDWMKNPELQELTASEPLTLQQEYDMQRSWRIDEDKCTFLILSQEIYDKTQNEIDALIGDTNLFISEGTDGKKVAEAEIMIAEKAVRGQRLGWEAMLLMLNYGIIELSISEFIVKIGAENEKSINMFKKILFEEISRSKVFNEVTLQRIVSDDWRSWLQSKIVYTIDEYDKVIE